MSISQLYIGSIIEDLRTNTIYEIDGVTMTSNNLDEYFRYTVRILVNPLNIDIKEITVANVSQLSNLHFFNIESKPDNDSGLVSFPIVTIPEEDSERLTSIDIFLKNYFYRVRLFKKHNTVYRVKFNNFKDKTVKLIRRANLIERFLYKKLLIVKIMSVTDLFIEYKVYTGH